MVKDPDGNTRRGLQEGGREGGGGGCNNLRNFIYVRKARYINVCFSLPLFLLLLLLLCCFSSSSIHLRAVSRVRKQNKQKICIKDNKLI